ncbi:hypothetical protein Y032_0243g3497 [Ancylostoma ceylanicum]|uniref:Ubiquinol-cytochrome-c reductase complex assembly factor 2 n=1 Tax=Ancylostoma ceylanicum TaxID=53326 RepID=A0A016SE92_9BILA|nr:hypothetical protein Y032_0243g3497 [Ancylostoma ceylanicum]
MSKYLYKQYVRLVTRWPKDQYKSPERDLAVFLSREVERQFKSEPSALDAALCERRYRALEQISENYTANLYPHQYKSGVFGLNLQQLQVFSHLLLALFWLSLSTLEFALVF